MRIKGLIFVCLLLLSSFVKGQVITKVEYYFDSDPGNGLGMNVPLLTASSIVDTSFVADISSVTIGLHTLYIRAMDDSNRWGQSLARPFLRTPSGAINNILQAEYFFDVDPGNGNGTFVSLTPDSIVQFNFSADLSSLTPGFHTLYIRAKDQAGSWSACVSRPVIVALEINPSVTAAEYFFDTDPGNGNGIPVTISPDSVVQRAFTADLTGLSSGLHTLYVRAKNQNNEWSLCTSRPFINVLLASPQVTRLEYYFDSDPGFGFGTPVTITNDSIVPVLFSADLNALSSGLHTIYVRAADQNMAWSHCYSRPFMKVDNNIVNVVSAEYFIDTDPGVGNGQAISVTADSLISTNFSADLSGSSTGLHVLYVRAKNANHVWGHTYSRPFINNGSQIFYPASGARFYIDSLNTTPQNFSSAPDTVLSENYTLNVAGLSNGFHAVYMQARNTNGEWSHMNIDSVCVGPQADFTAAAVCIGDTVSFTNISLDTDTNTHYRWDFNGDNVIDDTTANPQHYFALAQDYSVTLIVYNDLACADTIIKSVTVNALPVVSVVNSDPLCYGGANGSAAISVTGVSPYTFSWSDGQTTQNATGLTASSYTCTVTDSNGCINSVSTTLNQPAVLTVSISSTNETCNNALDGTATTLVTGGAGSYTYSWSNGQTSANISGLAANLYACTVMDTSSCIASDTVIITSPLPMAVTISTTDVSCNGLSDGSANALVTGGTGSYTYSWSNGQTLQNITGIAASTFICIATDINGCTISDTGTVAQPNPLLLNLTTAAENCYNADGVASATVAGGVAPYSYLWSNGDTSSSIIGLMQGSYNLNVTDANGCNAFNGFSIARNGLITIQGTATVSGSPLTNGTLIEYEIVNDTMAFVVDTTLAIAANGQYSINNIDPGRRFILAVIPDTVVYPNAVTTYYGNEYRWDRADTLFTVCGQNITADIAVNNLTTPTGTGVIRGQIVDVTDSTNQRRPGEPVIGVDVSIDQIPGGGQVQRVRSNAGGFYTFNNVAVGTYSLYVSVPGCSMVNTYTITMLPGEVEIEKDFYVDSLDGFIDTTSVVWLFSSNVTKHNGQLLIHPNPNKGIFTIDLPSQVFDNPTIRLMSITGQEILMNTADGNRSSQIKIGIPDLPKGIYFIEVRDKNNRIIDKIVVE